MDKIRTILLASVLGFTALAGSVAAKAHKAGEANPAAVASPAEGENEKEFIYTIDNENPLFTNDRKAQDVTVSGWRITCSDGNFEKGSYPYRVRIFVDATLGFESVHADGIRTIKEVKVYYQKYGNIYQNYMEAVNGVLDTGDYPRTYETWWPSPTTDTSFTKAQIKVVDTWNGGTNYLFVEKFKITYYENTMTASASDYEGNYDGEAHAPTVTVTEPSEGYKIEYSADNGKNYSEQIPEITKEVGEHSIKYRVSKNSYKNFIGTAKVTISENDKTALQAKIDEAEGLYDPLLAKDPDAAATFQEAINTAKVVEENPNVTVEEIEQAISDLNIKVEEAQEIINSNPGGGNQPGGKDTPSKAGLPAGAIVGIVLGGLVILLCGAWVLLMFVLNKWIKVGDKAVRAFKLFGLKKDGKPLVWGFPFKFVAREESEIFKTKEEALK